MAAQPWRTPWAYRPLARRQGHPLIAEVLLLAVLFLAYKLGRQLVSGHLAEAMHNAAWVWDFERWALIPNEATVQHWALGWEHTARLANLYYVGVHFPGTALMLIWLYARHRAAYTRVRTELVVLTAAGMALHMLFPLAPPRLAGVGLSDTMLSVGPSAYPAAADGIANQYAAMPSLHIGWALLVAVAVLRASRSRWRGLIVLHPVLTTFVVVVTANHYWLDGIAAIALLTGTIFAVRFVRAGRHQDPAPARHQNERGRVAMPASR